jgi:hypothetical protein
VLLLLSISTTTLIFFFFFFTTGAGAAALGASDAYAASCAAVGTGCAAVGTGAIRPIFEPDTVSTSGGVAARNDSNFESSATLTDALACDGVFTGSHLTADFDRDEFLLRCRRQQQQAATQTQSKNTNPAPPPIRPGMTPGILRNEVAFGAVACKRHCEFSPGLQKPAATGHQFEPV